jgi:AmpD protein
MPVGLPDPNDLPEWRIGSDGWVQGLERAPSPNFDARPDDATPTLVVIHNISLPPGEFGGPAVLEMFQNRLDCDAHPYYERLRDLRVSAHFFLRRDGSLLQLVSCEQRAWHAGQSSFRGRTRCNDFSIGIELEGADQVLYQDAQYQILARLLGALAARYPIDAIAGHSFIAPGRKTDPGDAFDWSRIIAACGLPSGYFP